MIFSNHLIDITDFKQFIKYETKNSKYNVHTDLPASYFLCDVQRVAVLKYFRFQVFLPCVRLLQLTRINKTTQSGIERNNNPTLPPAALSVTTSTVILSVTFSCLRYLHVKY